MPEDFGIDIRIAPSPQNVGEVAKLDRQLEGLERKGVATGKAIGDALAKGVGSHEAASEIERLAREFKALEGATLPAVRAEREYAAAVKLATDAVKAGVASEEQARAVIEAKSSAVDKASQGIRAYDEAMAQNARETLPSASSGLMGVLDAVGKVNGAMEMFNKITRLGELALKGYSAAASQARKALDDLTLSAPSDGLVRMDAIDQTFQEAAKRAGVRNFNPNSRDARLATAGLTDVDEARKAAATLASQMKDAQDKLDASLAATKAGLDRSLVDTQISIVTNQADVLMAKLTAQVADEARSAERGQALTRDQQRAHRELDKQVEALNRKIEGLEGASDYAAGQLGFRVDRPTAKASAARRPAAVEESVSEWDELAGYIRVADNALSGYVDTMSDLAAEQESSWSFEDQVSGWDEIEGAIALITDQATALYETMAKQAKPSMDWTKEYADALTNTLGGAFDDLTSNLVDSLAGLEVSWKDWGRSVLEEISKVIIKMLALQAISAGFGAYGGGGGIGGFLWGLVGGSSAPAGGTSARIGSGDAFRAGGAAPIVTERVAPATRAAPVSGSAPQVNVRVVNHHDAHRAALDAIATSEGERAILNVIGRNRGRLGV